MSEFVRWILDIDRIPADVPLRSLELGWERMMPGWMWGILFFAIGIFALWSYSGLVGNRTGRGILGVTRFLLLFLLLLVITGPTLVYPREHVEQDWVLMLVDRSQSMTVADVQWSPDRPGRISRDAQLAQSLRESVDGISHIESAHQTAWLGFDVGAFDLDVRSSRSRRPLTEAPEPEHEPAPGDESQATADVLLPVLGRPDGSQTAIGPAIEQALRRAAARPVSGIVLFSDGQTTDPPDREVFRRLMAEAIPVFVVPLGSDTSIGDLAIREVQAPDRAFVRDKTPVIVSLDHLGDALAQTGATVSLVDQATGQVMDRQRIEPGDETDRLTLTATPQQPGQASWMVRVETDVPDLIEDNNVKSIEIDLIDRPIRVLYIDGYPRWEYRYVKYTTIREKSIDSSVILLSADRDFAQEGNSPITRLPNSPEELDPYDVIIIGDVHSDFFSPRQLEMIYDHVAERGAGLLWIAGARANPSSYAGTPLASLLPMRSSAAAGFNPIGPPVTVEPTDLARSLGMLNLIDVDGTDAWETLSNPSHGWNQLQWALRIDPDELKPTTEILASTVERFATAENGLPIVMQMRFGAGRSVFVATDEIWRWRYGRGEKIPEQFWIQIIRSLGRERLTTSGRGATLSAQPRRVRISQPTVFELRIFDEKIIEQGIKSVPMEVLDESGRRVAVLQLEKQEGAEGRFDATFLPDRSGSFSIRPIDPPLNRMNLTAEIDVYRPDDEMQNPESDHEFLRQLAEQTGGAVIEPAEFAKELPDLLPKRTVRTQMDVVEPLWDTPLVLVIFLVLLTGEWVGRRLIRLI